MDELIDATFERKLPEVKATDAGLRLDELVDIGDGMNCSYGRLKARAEAIKTKTGKIEHECCELAMAELRAEMTKQGELV
jgi:hypothetical protein